MSPSAVGVTRALDMGQATIDHLDGYAEHLNGVTKPVDESALQDLVARTERAGTWIVPTLVLWDTLRGPVTLHSRTTRKCATCLMEQSSGPSLWRAP
jgi:hypothetical protein